MTPKERAKNSHRAGVIPAWPGCKTEWYCVLSIDAEDVADGKGVVIAAFPTRKEASACAKKVNEAITAAFRAAAAKERASCAGIAASHIRRWTDWCDDAEPEFVHTGACQYIFNSIRARKQ